MFSTEGLARWMSCMPATSQVTFDALAKYIVMFDEKNIKILSLKCDVTLKPKPVKLKRLCMDRLPDSR